MLLVQLKGIPLGKDVGIIVKREKPLRIPMGQS